MTTTTTNPGTESEDLDFRAACRIAHFGAKKMDEQGYSYAPASSGVRWFVVNPAGVEYLVNPAPKVADACDCPFCQANGICKHIYWLRRKLKEAAQLLLGTEEDWARAEAADAEERYHGRNAGLS